MSATRISGIGRLVTGTAAGTLEEAELVLAGGRIAWLGRRGEQPPGELLEQVDEEVDAAGGLVTAGLVDAHTHPVYAGDRHAEVAARTAGKSYTDVGAEGGIGATVAATRTCPPDDLERKVRDRLSRFLEAGTTTVEAKTGYHLEQQGERAAVELLRRLGDDPAMPRTHVTFLPAHALPPEAQGDWDAYAAEVADWSPEAAAAGADACDVFCDEGFFTVEQSRTVLAAGKAAGLQVRIHADELARTGGSLLAAELGAASADHLLRATADDARALARAGVVATLCPTTALSMGRLPDVGTMRDAGVTIALGTDHNSGTSGAVSMSLVVALAVWALRMTADEALRAATVGGASSLGRDDIGVVAQGAAADVVWWDADHEGAFAWAWGLEPLGLWRSGRRIA